MSPGELWDDPNQQVVRADESASWEEGAGAGEAPEPPDPPDPPDPPTVPPEGNGEEEIPLEEMTKSQLLRHAGKRGLELDESLTKSEIREAIDEA